MDPPGEGKMRMSQSKLTYMKPDHSEV
jgi:hypothetical protein